MAQTEKSSSKKATKPRNTKIVNGKFFKAQAQVVNGSLIVKLPAGAAEYLAVQDGSLYWIAFDDTIQLCGEQPHMVIPAFSMNVDSFLKKNTRKS